jgi:microcompartment protein CcmK/EutM
MTITVEQLPGEPILIATFIEPMDYHQDAPWMFQRFVEMRDTDLEGYSRYYTIIDTNGVKAGFSDIVFTLGESRAARQHRREDRPVSLALVGSGGLMELASKAMGQSQYGGYSMRLFTSLDAALEATRAELVEIPALES